MAQRKRSAKSAKWAGKESFFGGMMIHGLPIPILFCLLVCLILVCFFSNFFCSDRSYLKRLVGEAQEAFWVVFCWMRPSLYGDKSLKYYSKFFTLHIFLRLIIKQLPFKHDSCISTLTVTRVFKKDQPNMAPEKDKSLGASGVIWWPSRWFTNFQCPKVGWKTESYPIHHLFLGGDSPSPPVMSF